VQADRVQLGVVEQFLFGQFPVKDCEPDDWDRCDHDVVQVKEDVRVNVGAAEETEPTEHEDGDHQNDILVEHVHDQVCVAAVCFTTVREQQVFQHLELADCVVSGARSLLALEPRNTDADVGGSDHRDVVGTVANREGRLLRHAVFDHLDDVSLLLRGDSAAKHDLNALESSQINEVRLQFIRLLNHSQLESINDDGALAGGRLLLCIVVQNFLSKFAWGLRFHDKPVLVSRQQLARLSDINSGLNLVASEDPDLDARLLDISDGLANIFLELVLDGGTASQ